MNKKVYQKWMKSQKEVVESYILSEKFNTQGSEDWGVASFVGGVKIEWNWQGSYIKLGIGSTENDRVVIYNYLVENKIDVEKSKSLLSWVKQNKCTVDDFKIICELFKDHKLELEKRHYHKKAKEQGVNFKGTVFQSLKERGATIGGMMGKMVCEVAGINRDYLLPEFHTKNSGEIDGVEICPDTQKPITIYECQSGIHYGNYLDEHHLNKGLHKYLYAEEIVNTVKKVVFLAGGYSNSVKNIIKERRKELLNRDNPIEVVLLKTTKKENKIGIVEVVL